MFSSQEIDQFKRICASFGISPSHEMLRKFRVYADLLLEWNKRIHLVSKKDATNDRIIRHFIDSLSIFSAIGGQTNARPVGSASDRKAIDLLFNANVLDLGSGAGFPSIPIKIVRDDIKLTLVESIHKKTLFLQKLSAVLELKEMNVINQRAEELFSQEAYKEKFDLITAKALGRLSTTVRVSSPFLKIGGLLVAYKGRGVENEVEEIKSLEKCRIKDVKAIRIPEMKIIRWLVIIEKLK